MKDAQKPDHVSLNTLINRLKEGRFVIPDFQREFEWRPWDIRELMRSVFLESNRRLAFFTSLRSNDGRYSYYFKMHPVFDVMWKTSRWLRSRNYNEQV
jgi:uncharacterized protein with ParB-like and HNH nuclease domain